MRFRPCIDIHNGQVKQIVGSSLKDEKDQAAENFVSGLDGAYYAKYYQQYDLIGGHIILLNPVGSKYYEQNCQQAFKALQAYPMGLQVGGGITEENALPFLERGASHVIVTSYVFREGKIDYNHLEKLYHMVGKERLVLDLSCRRRDRHYYIVTNRWQTFTKEPISNHLLDRLSKYCDEFLIHAVDVEGKTSGIEEELVQFLGNWDGIPITYAGGVGSFEDLNRLGKLSNDKLDVTIGSALDLFGGTMDLKQVVNYCKKL